MNAGVFLPEGILTPGAGLVGSGARAEPVATFFAVSAAGRAGAELEVEDFFAPEAAVLAAGVGAGPPLGAVLSPRAVDASGASDDTAAVSCTAAVSDACFEGEHPAAASAAATVIAATGVYLTVCPP